MKNRIKEILTERGFFEFSPTEELLEKLNIKRPRFFRLVNNIGIINGVESVAIAKWLDVEVSELFEKKRIAEDA